MYQVKIEEAGRIKMPTNTYYAETLGITSSYVSSILNGKLPVKQIVAKGMLCIAYNITMDDPLMDELLEKHFEKIK